MTKKSYNDITERVLDLLKKSKLNETVLEFAFGELENHRSTISPACHVMLDKPYSSSDETGTGRNNDTQYTTEIAIKLIASSAVVENTTRQMNALIETAIDVFVKNPTLAKGSAATAADPIFIRSTITSVDKLESMRGKTRQVAIIILQGQVGSQITIKIPGISAPLSIINKPVSRENTSYAPHLDTAGTLTGYAATGKSNVRYYEVEDYGDIITALRKIKNTFVKNTYTINNAGKKSVFTGYLSSISPGQNYDELPLITLQFEVL